MEQQWLDVPRLYLETTNEVVSCEQLVEYEFERMITAGLVQSEHVKRPFVNILWGKHTKGQ